MKKPLEAVSGRLSPNVETRTVVRSNGSIMDLFTHTFTHTDNNLLFDPARFKENGVSSAERLGIGEFQVG
jgi:hypothetical protein